MTVLETENIPLKDLELDNINGFAVARSHNKLVVCKTSISAKKNAFNTRAKSWLKDPKIFPLKTEEGKLILYNYIIGKEAKYISVASFLSHEKLTNFMVSSLESAYIFTDVNSQYSKEIKPEVIISEKIIRDSKAYPGSSNKIVLLHDDGLSIKTML